MRSLYDSKNRIETLKKRSKRCVCSYCGGELNLRRIIFNDIQETRVEIFCEACDRIEFGIEPEIYSSAVNLVDNLEFNCFEGFSQNEKLRKMNIAKVCEILAWGCKNMGLIDDNGFKVPIQMAQENWAECLIMVSEELDGVSTFEKLMEEKKCNQL